MLNWAQESNEGQLYVASQYIIVVAIEVEDASSLSHPNCLQE